MQGSKIAVKDWKELLLTTLMILAKSDKQVMEKFTEMKEMNEKRKSYFSHQPLNMRRPVVIEGTNIYVETNMNANSIRTLIIKVLQQYKISISDYKIYLRADYTELH